MAEGFNLDKGKKRDPKKEVLEIGVVVQDALRSMADNVQDIIAESLGNLGDVSDATLKDIQKGFRDLSKVGTTLATSSEQAMQGEFTRSKLNKILLDRKAKQLALETNIEIINNSTRDLSKEQKQQIEKITKEKEKQVEFNELLEKSLREQYKRSKRINQAQGLSGVLLGGMEKSLEKLGMSGLSDVFADAKSSASELAQKLTEGGTKGGGMFGKLRIASKGFGTALAGLGKYLMGPAGLAMLLAKAVQFMLKLDEGTSKTAQSLNMSGTEAAELRKNVVATAENVDYMTERLGETVELMNRFADTTGIISTNTDVFNTKLGLAQRLLGLSNNQVDDLGKFLLATGQSSEEFVKNLMGGAEAAEISLGINLQQQNVQKEIADLTDRQRLNLESNPLLIGKAVANARALGLNFKLLEGTMDGLLNFEESISNELEAELLLNKELNLERARAAALNNDYETVAAEISKNLGSAAEFGNMNRIAQEAFARSVGMTVDDLAKVLVEQEALEKSGYATAKARQDDFNALVKRIGFQKAVAEFGDQEFAQLQANISMQEKFNNVVQNLKTIFAESIAPEVEKIANYLKENPDTINNIVDSLKGFVTGVMNVGTFIDGLIVKPLSMTVNTIKSIGQLTSSVGRLVTGDFSGAKNQFYKSIDSFAMAGANALDSGTNILVGAGVEGEANFFSNYSKSNQMADYTVDDFTLRTNPKDTLVMAGGTKFGEETNALLKELIAATKEARGDVLIDGNKAGIALNLASYNPAIG